MKTFTKTIVIAALTVSSIGFANAANILVPADGYVTSDLCVVASQGSKAKLAKAIKKAGLTKRYVANNVQCNEQNIITFVEQYGSNVEQINNFMTHGDYNKTAEMPDLVSR